MKAFFRKLFKSKMSSETNNTVEKVLETGESVVSKLSSKAQATERAKMDLATESKLTQNIRPYVMLWTMAMITAMLVLWCIGFKIPDEVSNTIQWIAPIVFGFYFPGRTLEKWSKNLAERRKKEKEKKQNNISQQSN